MTEQRHRQCAFPSPLNLEGFDLEKELYVPRRDRIFVPSNYVSAPSLGDVMRDIDRYMERYIERHAREYMESICTPSREEMFRERQVFDLRWANLERSEVPAWRSNWRRNGRHG